MWAGEASLSIWLVTEERAVSPLDLDLAGQAPASLPLFSLYRLTHSRYNMTTWKPARENMLPPFDLPHRWRHFSYGSGFTLLCLTITSTSASFLLLPVSFLQLGTQSWSWSWTAGIQDILDLLIPWSFQWWTVHLCPITSHLTFHCSLGFLLAQKPC